MSINFELMSWFKCLSIKNLRSRIKEMMPFLTTGLKLFGSENNIMNKLILVFWSTTYLSYDIFNIWLYILLKTSWLRHQLIYRSSSSKIKQGVSNGHGWFWTIIPERLSANRDPGKIPEIILMKFHLFL